MRKIVSTVFQEPSWRFQGRRWFFYLAIVLLIGAFVRMGNLHLLPPFIDESGHIYAAIHYDFYPLLERLRAGKLFGYLIFYPTARFAENTLVATRFLIGTIGLSTILGVFLLTRRLTDLTASVFAAILWSLMPYVVFHDRLALHDPISSACLVWSIVACVAGVTTRSRLLGGIGGTLMGLAILTKLNSAIGILWIACIVSALIDWSKPKVYLRVCGAFVGGLALSSSAMFIAILKGGIEHSSHLRTGATETGSGVFWLNVRTVVDWFAEYNSLPFTILVALALIESVRKPTRLTSALFLSFMASLVIHAVLFKEWFPRYFLPSLIPLVILIGTISSAWLRSAIVSWRRRFRQPTDWIPLGGTLIVGILLILSAFHWVRFAIVVSHDPTFVRIPPIDRYQYIDGWPNGSGLEEVAAFLNKEASRTQDDLLLLVGGFGRHGWWSLPLIGSLDPRIRIRSEHIVSRQDLYKATVEAARQPTFILFEPPVYSPTEVLSLAQPSPKLVLSYERPRTSGGFRLYALDSSTRLGMSAEQQRLLKSGLPVIREILNPNGLENFDGQAFIWLGGKDTVLQIDSPHDGVAELVATFLPGPSLPDTGSRRLIIKGEEGFRATTTVLKGHGTLRIPLRSGTNEVAMSCPEKPTISKQSNGDTRPLILGILGLRIEAFREKSKAR